MYIIAVKHVHLHELVSVDGVYNPKDRPQPTSYRIVGYFRGVLIFVIFMVSLQVTKISTYKFFHPNTVSTCTSGLCTCTCTYILIWS